METEQDPYTTHLNIPGFSTLPDVWFSHFLFVFLIILGLQFVRALEVIQKLRSILIYLIKVATPSGRKSRREQLQIIDELVKCRTTLKTMSMTENFAKYAKLERQIKAYERRLNELDPRSLEDSVIRFAGVRILLFVIEGLVCAWLVNQSPKMLVTNNRLENIKYRFLYPIWLIIYYIPVQCITILWILLCRVTMSPFVIWFVKHLSSMNKSHTSSEREQNEIPFPDPTE